MGQTSLTGHRRPETNDPVTLLLLQHLFPGWTITRDEHGTWQATGRVALSASDVDGLLDLLALAAPDTARRAVSLLSEKR
ncbi:hypothetical protein E1281_24165 [Actinomadura sp. KC345]|uniref:hypothetical protein n=1 Tax=Actinomadura sp. KC345 TaxID=2530371 RepID=UPI0010434BC6|nr:hypothetical protein [Actinomadura sp. KC345]TDC48823.1 hypothetical protein E1281_24165 [Actinomadura sp. KC345]